MRTKREHGSDTELDVTLDKRRHVASEVSAPLDVLHAEYLRTISRPKLDFDFERICSVTLSTVNVYACLVCGKYFQGRSKTSCAFAHSLDDDHHVFINLETLKVYILPENQEVTLKSEILDDIRAQVDPKFDEEDLQRLYSSKDVCFDLQHRPYRPGFVGLNKIRANDYANVVFQVLSHVNPLRDYLLLNHGTQELSRRLSLLIRKTWSSKLAKPHLSPHEIMQYSTVKSENRFTIADQRLPKDFLVWLLGALNTELAQPGKKHSLVTKLFQGKVKVTSEKLDGSRTVSLTKYWLLTLDPPPFSLFKDGTGLTQVPQVSITQLLQKYDGQTQQKLAKENRTFKLVTVPPFLLLHVNRSSGSQGLKGVLGTSHNPTVVKFPFENLDMSPYIENAGAPLHYKLIGNVVQETIPVTSMIDGTEVVSDSQVYKVHLLDQVRGDWLEIQDLQVKPVEKELLFMEETNIQIWQRV